MHIHLTQKVGKKAQKNTVTWGKEKLNDKVITQTQPYQYLH